MGTHKGRKPVVRATKTCTENGTWDSAMPRKRLQKKIKPSIGARVATKQVEVARFFGVTLSAVRFWSVDGMPGRPGYYPLDEITRWYLGRVAKDKQPTEAKQRLLQTQVALAEYELAEKERKYIPAHGLREGLQLLVDTLKQCMDALHRDCGAEASEVMREHIDELESDIGGLLSRSGIPN